MGIKVQSLCGVKLFNDCPRRSNYDFPRLNSTVQIVQLANFYFIIIMRNKIFSES